MLSERNTLVQSPENGAEGHRLFGVRIAADEAEILSIAVAQTIGGRGLSNTLLLTAILGHLAGRGVRTVFLESGGK